jgi:hypothetical protein
MRSNTNTILAAATFATMALARTDLEGCTRTDVSSPAGASYAWYVPGTGEVCEILDCGGGRAPPKTTVPGCAAYVGTETYSPSYLAGYQASATAAPSTTAATEESTSSSSSGYQSSATAAPSTTDATEDSTSSSSSGFDWNVLETDTAISNWDLYTSTLPLPWTSGAGPISSITTITDGSTLVAQTTAAGNAPNNGTVSTGRPANNGTISTGTASPTVAVSDSGVAGSAQAWVGGAGLMMGLAGLVAVL